MINANGLRIGNYVLDAISGEWMIVDEIGENVGAVLINRNKYPLPDGWQMASIPLTPELLEKCGFELKEDKYFEKGLFVIYEFSEGIYTIYNYTLPDVKYLHQLQNLYYAVTGEELQIEF